MNLQETKRPQDRRTELAYVACFESTKRFYMSLALRLNVDMMCKIVPCVWNTKTSR